MRARFLLSLALGPACIAVGACNVLTGASDLGVGAEKTSSHVDGGPREGAADDAAAPPDAGGPTDGTGADASVGDGGCASTSATSLLGHALPVATYYELTPEKYNLAGGLASPAVVSLDNFDASFDYSITYTSQSTPGAGLAFFAIASAMKTIGCRPGPYLCTLGASAPGFAVIIRTSKLISTDPAVPYVAVVDAQSFPVTQPANPTALDTSKAWTLVNDTSSSTLPAKSTFHQLAISVRAGMVTVTIDGGTILSNAPIPNWVAGRVGTWGVGAATGEGTNFAQRTVVGPVTFNGCR